MPAQKNYVNEIGLKSSMIIRQPKPLWLIDLLLKLSVIPAFSQPHILRY